MEFKVWAIGYKHEEDVYFDFETNSDTFSLKPSCFLPTKKVAENVIEDELSTYYFPVEIEIDSVNRGSWAWSRDMVPGWDDHHIEEE